MTTIEKIKKAIIANANPDNEKGFAMLIIGKSIVNGEHRVDDLRGLDIITAKFNGKSWEYQTLCSSGSELHLDSYGKRDSDTAENMYFQYDKPLITVMLAAMADYYKDKEED